MGKQKKLCPYKKVVERETSAAGVTVERERFQSCIGKKCMAYVHIAPCINLDAPNDPSDWAAPEF